jgi:hypothetical protein
LFNVTASGVGCVGQVTSPETHPRHFTRTVALNGGFFAHDRLVSPSFLDVATNEKKASTTDSGMVNDLVPVAADVIDAEPSELTSIWYAFGSSGRDPRMTALSTGVAAIRRPVAKAVKNREKDPTVRSFSLHFLSSSLRAVLPIRLEEERIHLSMRIEAIPNQNRTRAF